MSDHLPECDDFRDSQRPRPCICPWLGEAVAEADLPTQRIAARAEGYAMGRIDGDSNGYVNGLDAARDAVAALDHAPRCELVWGCECSESHPMECTCNRDEALAAIDKLGEQA